MKKQEQSRRRSSIKVLLLMWNRWYDSKMSWKWINMHTYVTITVCRSTHSVRAHLLSVSSDIIASPSPSPCTVCGTWTCRHSPQLFSKYVTSLPAQTSTLLLNQTLGQIWMRRVEESCHPSSGSQDHWDPDDGWQLDLCGGSTGCRIRHGQVTTARGA